MKFVGPMNSARVHCSRENWSTTVAETKKTKKKKAKNVLELKTWTWTCIQMDTKTLIMVFYYLGGIAFLP